MKFRVGLAVAVAAVTTVVCAVPAGAVVTQLPNGKTLGYQPLNGQSPTAYAKRDANGNLDYHGGPVMPSNKEFAIFWQLPGQPYPAGYEAGITQYMKDVATDSGFPTNVYSVGSQYTDSQGNHAAYRTTYGGTFDDTDAFPSDGCPLYTAANDAGTAFAHCITDAQLSAEVDSFVASHGLPRGLTNEYFVFLPPSVGSCFTSGGTADTNGGCFDTQFCAYHASNPTGGLTLYANESFTPIDPPGCGTGQYPNGQANGIDDELSSLSHEANESITDPVNGTGWWDNGPGPLAGQENGDQCRNTGSFVGDFGPTAGPNGALFNQIIGGRRYILQQEWSNAANGCEQFYNLSGTTFAPFKAKVGKSVNFSAKIVDAEGGALKSVKWDFGDGHKATGKSVSHTYKHTGKFTVGTLLTNNTGLNLIGVRKIKIKPKHSKTNVSKVVRVKMTRR